MNQTQSTQSELVNNEGSCCCYLQAFMCLCFFIGLVKIGQFLWTICGSFFRRRLDLKKRYGGGWALVTGGSEGIGQAIALQLARSGFDLILVSRNADKLSKAKDRILQINPKIQIQVHSIDLCKLTTEDQYVKAFGQILSKDISILVNNVGYYAPKCFDELTYNEIRSQVKINILPIAVLTRLYVERALKREKRSGIINLSSGAAMLTYGGVGHYSATKTFDDFFSQALEYEVRKKIDVLTVRPFYVTTPMTRNTTSLTHATAQQIGREVINSLGNINICYGTFTHRLNAAMINLAPQRLSSYFATKSVSEFKKEFQKAD